MWRAELERDWPIRGAVGRVLIDDADRGLLVQTGEGLLWLSETESTRRPAVGCRLGFVVENELAKLTGRMAELEARLDELSHDRSHDRSHDQSHDQSDELSDESQRRVA